MKTVLFGANDIAAEVIKKHKQDYIVVDSFKQGVFLGLEIRHPRFLVHQKEFDKVIICTDCGFQEVLSFLNMIGIVSESIFTTDLECNLIPINEFLNFRKQHILITTLPKSGTVWFRKALYRATKRPYVDYSYNFYRPNFADEGYFHYETTANAFKSGTVNVEHQMSNDVNITSLKQDIDNGLKLIVHFRDPRQALLSWLHQLNTRFQKDDKDIIMHGIRGFYDCSTFEDKADYLVENFFPKFILWLSRWKNFIDNVDNNLFLVTRHENLSADPISFNQIICDFLNIRTSQLGLGAQPEKGKSHFRSGLVDEWKTAFSQKTRNKMADQLKECQLIDFVESFGL